MSNFNSLYDKIIKWEPSLQIPKDNLKLVNWKIFGYDGSDDSIDTSNLIFHNKSEFEQTFKTLYWDRWNADYIKNQSIANILVDWSYSSGAVPMVITKRIFGLNKKSTIESVVENINKTEQSKFHKSISVFRYLYYKSLLKKDIKQVINFKEWILRLSDFRYEE